MHTAVVKCQHSNSLQFMLKQTAITTQTSSLHMLHRINQPPDHQQPAVDYFMNMQFTSQCDKH
uniref:Uncharacterized protein n=1 Tax=Arion vulgaris TaxID=1028688 RepID=A0A0B7B9L5_9EUPU